MIAPAAAHVYGVAVSVSDWSDVPDRLAKLKTPPEFLQLLEQKNI